MDLLAALVGQGYFDEMAHVISEHNVSPLRLIERITGSAWVPEGRAKEPEDDPDREDWWPWK